MKKIAILCNSLSYPLAEDSLSYLMNPSSFLKDYETEIFFLDKKNSVEKIKEIFSKGFTSFFNLCDGAIDENRAGLEVVLTLELLNVPFTGADSNFYEPTRIQMKWAAHKHNIQVPRSISRYIEKEKIEFPMIVKHPNSYSSIGLTKESLVTNEKELNKQIQRMQSLFSGYMVEEYISGREFTVLVAESPHINHPPIVFEPLEIFFPEDEEFKHYDLKWNRYNELYYDEVKDLNIRSELVNSTTKIFQELKGTGYARCDFRYNNEKGLFFLEINPNCGIFYKEGEEGSADWILKKEQNGYEKFINLILRVANNRVKDK